LSLETTWVKTSIKTVARASNFEAGDNLLSLVVVFYGNKKIMPLIEKLAIISYLDKYFFPVLGGHLNWVASV
jgi:hypothetical protein